MSVVIINVSNHKLTPVQTYDNNAKVIELPSKLSRDFSQIVPSAVNEIADRIVSFIMSTNNDYKYDNKVLIHLAGHPATTMQVFNRLNHDWFYYKGTQFVYAHSVRESVEEVQEDGSVVKRNVFNFNGWYDYQDNSLVELKNHFYPEELRNIGA